MDAPLKLSESEHRCFWEMFNYMDGENCGVLSMNQVYELLLTSGLATEVVHQILELSAAKQGHFSRNQFFVALKLVAAAQNKYPVVLDICYSGIELPLPRFMPQSDNWRNQNPSSLYSKQQQQMQQHIHLQQQHLQQQHQQLQQQQQQLLQLKAQFQKQHVHHQEAYLESGARIAAVQPPSRSMSLAGPNETPIFPQTSTTTSASYLASSSGQVSATSSSSSSSSSNAMKFIPPGSGRKQSAPVVIRPPQQAPVNNIGTRNESAFVDLRPEKGWASFEEDPHLLLHHQQQQQQHFQLHNQHQALQMEADSSSGISQRDWANFPAEGPSADVASVCSEGQLQEDVWCMTEEQRDYYINQFKTMQDNLKGAISGGIAKEFFEKSKLPVKELSKIWQLSDVNRDGVLTLPEFCTAMHLVVLRRNDIELPDQLPPSLMNQLQTFPHPDHLHNGQGDEACGMESQPAVAGYKKSSSSPSSSHSSQVWNSGYSVPVESPTSSSVSSPGNKPTPVNFEFQPVTFDPDSKIVQPVAVKMSPDDTPFVVDSDAASFTEDPHDVMTSSIIKKVSKQDLLIDLDMEHGGVTSMTPAVPQNVLQGRPRPTPIKPPVHNLPRDSSSSQVHKKLILPPPSSSSSSLVGVAMAVERSDVPPPPPPRLGHSRNSSLDNQLISLSPDGTDANQTTQVKFPPAVPPRPSSKERTLSSPEEGKKLPKKKIVSKHDSLDRRDLQASIRIQRERNLVLTRANWELNQELQEVMEQRIALEIQMEHLQG